MPRERAVRLALTVRRLLVLSLAAALAGCGGGATSTSQLPVPDLGLRSAEAARACLEHAGFGVLGGPRPAGDKNAPNVELILNGNPAPAFIAFYRGEARAERYEPQLIRNAARFNGSVERRGAVSIVWVQKPQADLRRQVHTCVF